MTREEAKEAVKIMEAYANGKKIQYINDNNEWVEPFNPVFDWSRRAYRIKPEQNYRPFKTQEECWSEKLKHQPFGYIKGKEIKNIVCITEISTSSTHNELYLSLSHITSVYDAVFLFDSYTFADGTPFGVKDVQPWQ